MASPPTTLFLRLGLGVFLAINLMAVSWIFYSREIFGAPASPGLSYSALRELFSYLALFLATAVLVLLGVPLFASILPAGEPEVEEGKAARRSNLARLPAIGSRHLILLGVVSAYCLSAYNTFRGEGSLYFDTAAMVLVAVTLGSFLEAKAKRQASVSARSMDRPLPRTIQIRRNGNLREVAPEGLQPGDLTKVLPGEVLAVDGSVQEGRSRVDEASLTGEARPRTVEAGARVLAGTINLEGRLWIRAERVATETVLSQTERSLEEARALQPSIQRLADRVAGVFVPMVSLLALLTFSWAAWAGEPAEGLLRALSVLLISCPCALGLAAPLATWNALRRAAERGILVDSAITLERAAAVDRFYFDKTGTLTKPDLDLEAIVTAEGVSPTTALHWAAQLESAAPHPIAKAFLDRARKVPRSSSSEALESAREVRIHPGRGVEGWVLGSSMGTRDHLRLGSATWVRESGLSTILPGSVHHDAGGPEDSYSGESQTPPRHLLEASGDDPRSSVYLFSDTRVLARFELLEGLRPGARKLIKDLSALGIRSFLLSGDTPEATRAMGRQLGIEGEGALLPAEKVQWLTEERTRSKRCLAMAGDGLNDAPVLAAADLGVALGSASDLARRCANVRLVDDRLDRIAPFIEIARHCRWRIRANLVFSFLFNSIGIVLAVTGHLNPVFAALAMVISSLVVVRISRGAGAVPGDSPERSPTLPRRASDGSFPLPLEDGLGMGS